MSDKSARTTMTRLEDHRMITGTGRYTDDIEVSGAAHGYVLRSPHAHAKIGGVDTAAARTMPGVLAVLTASDAAEDGLGRIRSPITLPPEFGEYHDPGRPLLASRRVRHVGDPVAFVVAETLDQAKDAAEAIAVDYEPLPAVILPDVAVQAGAPVVWDDAARNVCFASSLGDAAATERAFAQAVHVTVLEIEHNRVVVNTIEPRAAIAIHGGEDDSYTLYVGSQGVHLIRRVLADDVFGIAPERLRVVTRDVGGGFGMKLFIYPEYALVLWASRRTGRPVRWAAERTESFLSDAQARDFRGRLELAIGDDGVFLALRLRTFANLGGYLSTFAASVATRSYMKLLPNVYRIPHLHLEITGVFTNTVPVDAYRGAAKPEAVSQLERLIDIAAVEVGIDRVELRRRNLVRQEDMPYVTPVGEVYDGGDYAAVLDQALIRSDYASFAERREEALSRGRSRGIGVGMYVHGTGGDTNERSRVEVRPEGRVLAYTGTQSTGQGHETVFGKLVADRFGLPLADVALVQGDSAILDRGGGTGGSSSLLISGNTLVAATDKAIEWGRQLAADVLEAAPADIEFGEARFTVAGTDRSIGLYDLAGRAADHDGFYGDALFSTSNATYPYGCQVCEVEIDRDTGAIAIVRYVSVDDFGKMLHPDIVAGQVHGGLVQGIGQVLGEHAVYDPATGQLLAGSFMDYVMPRAADMPSFELHFMPLPSEATPLGVKGAGECGTIGAPGTVINAVMDALRPDGVRHLDMPVTPEKLWRAMRK